MLTFDDYKAKISIIQILWQLIGRTPLKLYDADREKPVLLEAGQYIKFAAVTEEEYKKIEKEVEDGTYKYVVYDKEV